jgi:multidrug efflux pump
MVLRSGDDFASLFQTAERIKEQAQRSGLFAFVDSDLAFDSPQALVAIDADRAGEMGVTTSSVANTLAILVGENYVNRFNWYDRAYDVIVQVPQAKRLSPDDLRHYYVSTASGKQVPLGTIINVETKPQADRLSQFNQMNAVTLSAVILPGVSMGSVIDYLKSLPKPPGVQIDWMSDSRQYINEGHRLTTIFGFALIFIFLVLAVQFESLRDPLVILVTVPLAV